MTNDITIDKARVSTPADSTQSGPYAPADLPGTMGALIASRGACYPDEPFLICGGGSLTFGEMDRQSDRFGRGLLKLGLRPGDRMLFQMGTVAETIVALFGCFRAGIVPVCTLPQHREIEIDEIGRITGARAHIVQQTYSASFDLQSFAQRSAARGGLERLIISLGGKPCDGIIGYGEVFEAADRSAVALAATLPKIAAHDLLLLQLSGGSTGRSKIIPRFNSEYIRQANSIVRRYEITRQDVGLWALPIIHNASMIMMMIPALIAGAKVVLRSRYDVDDYVQSIICHKVTYAGSIGPMTPSLIDRKQGSTEDYSSLRLFFTLDRAAVLEKILRCPVMNLYGITEGLLMTASPRDSEYVRHYTVGYPTGESDEIRLVDTDNGVPILYGIAGELLFRGDHAINGYYNEVANAASFDHEGFIRTGDLMSRERVADRDVFIFMGRLKDNINRGGEKFSAEEVESVLEDHPAIADVKLIPYSCKTMGERACACIVLRAGHEMPGIKDLSAFLDMRGMARFKHPERVALLKTFPTTSVGKVDRRGLRQMVAGAKL